MSKKESQYLAGRYACQTDVGRVRANNEDRVVALTNEKGNVLLIVCDGMGGQNKGDYASTLATKVISDSFNSKGHFFSAVSAARWMHKIVREANEEIYEESCQKPSYKGMGTTLSMVLIMKNRMMIAHAGDSRIYKIDPNNNVLEQVSDDQTYVNYLYKTGQIKKEEMLSHPKRHILMNAIGIYPSANIDFLSLPYHHEQIMLCSDGLYNNVSNSTIESILLTDDTPDEKVTKLISIANHNGGSDNIACIVWEAL